MMTQKSRTVKCRNRYIIFALISAVILFGVTLFSVISVFIKIAKPSLGTGTADEGLIQLTDSAKKTIVGFGITTVITLIATIFISNKLRTTVYMLCVIVSTIIYGEAALYTLFAIWFVDEYVFKALSSHYKQAFKVNKEIDMREE